MPAGINGSLCRCVKMVLIYVSLMIILIAPCLLLVALLSLLQQHANCIFITSNFV